MAYIQRYNSTYGYEGQLFRGLFKSILVEEDNHLLELVRYIHKNTHNNMPRFIFDPLKMDVASCTALMSYENLKSYVQNIIDSYGTDKIIEFNYSMPKDLPLLLDWF